MSRLLLMLIGLVAMAAVCLAYKVGPPVDTYPQICESMLPIGHCASDADGHSTRRKRDTGCVSKPDERTNASTDAAPYTLTAPTCYKQGAKIRVKLQVKSEPKDYYFEGLFVQARMVNNDTDSYGTFSTDDNQLGALDCFSKENNALGQTEGHHYSCKDFMWEAPDNFTDKIEFVATVVKGESTFWIGVKSGQLTYKADCAARTDDQKCSDDSSGTGRFQAGMTTFVATVIAISVFIRF